MAQDSIRMAVVGVGYFGSFHCDKLATLPGVQLIAVVDADRRRAEAAAGRFRARALTDHNELAGAVDAAVVAVPTQAHHLVAADLLRAGIDLLVEKPLAASRLDAEELCRLAETHGAALQVGHLERFNPIFAAATTRLHPPLRAVRLERTGPFPGRGAETDVVFELMTHDLDIVRQLTGAPLVGVTACGFPLVTRQLDWASARLEFADGLVAELLAARIGTRRTRNFSLIDSAGLLEVDLAERRLRRSAAPDSGMPPDELALGPGDPLLEQDRAFVAALRDGRRPVVDGRAGTAAVELAEAIHSAIDGRGRVH